MPHVESRREQRRALLAEGAPSPRELAMLEHERPRIRADCIDGPRPCPWVSCRHHLGIDPRAGGGILFNYDDNDGLGNGTQPTCALDVVDTHESLTLEAIGSMLGTTREWIRQLEFRALRNLADALRKDEES